MDKQQQTGNLDSNGPNATSGEARPDDKVQDKSGIGGKFNSGVTSSDPEEKRNIEKQGTMLDHQPGEDNSNGDDEAH